MAVTTAAVVGIATGVASTAKSFSDASKAKKAQDAANKEAARLMGDARKRAETNYFEGLQIPLDAYEKAFETTLTADRQMVEALQEGDTRALAAGAGRVGATAREGAEKTRIAMGQDLFNLDKTKAQSRENVKQQLIGMDVGAAKDAKAEAAYQEQLRASRIQQGIAGIGQVAGTIGANAALFSGKGAVDPTQVANVGGGGDAARNIQIQNPTEGLGAGGERLITDEMIYGDQGGAVELTNFTGSGGNYGIGGSSGFNF